MEYEKLARVYEALGETTKRLKKTEILSDFLDDLPKDESETTYLLLGEIYPSYDGRKMGISNKLLIKALAKASGNEKEKIEREWKSEGDLGKVAEKLIKKTKQSTLDSKTLTVKKVINNLRKLPDLEGEGTIDKKISLITELLTSAKPLEAKYLARTLAGELRIGIQESSVRTAMADAFFVSKDKGKGKTEEEGKEDKQQAEDKIQEALDKSNDIAKVFEIAKQGKLKELEKVELEIGKPIKAMLAQKVNSISDGFEALGKPAVVEYKYDGFRLFVHKKEDKVYLFTRRLEDVTSQFPEVEDYVKKYVKGREFILDTEAVGYDSKAKEYKPFQEISQRIQRKYNIDKLQKELPIEVNVFDILYYEGESYLDKPFKERNELMEKIIDNKKYKLIHAKQVITEDEKEAQDFYKEALKNNQEGIIMKNLEAKYQPGNRVGHMLKIKPEERDLDLVITGAEYGTGKRSGWLSSFIISCYNEENDEYQEVGKVGTGIKEKTEEVEDSGEKGKEDEISFYALTEKLKPLIEKESGREVKIKPQIVVSVTYQEIQKSPNYESGYALRFPRFTKLRPDRSPERISTLEEIKEDYKRQ